MINIFNDCPKLENERVLLRALREDDFENLLSFSLEEHDIWKYGLVTAAGEENLKNYIGTAVQNLSDRKEYPFIVYDKQAKSYAGSTRFYDIQQSYLTTPIRLYLVWKKLPANWIKP
jgi:RimJ/RimL family protein N-acetyltransferase